MPLIGIASWAAVHQKEVLTYTAARHGSDMGEKHVLYRPAKYNRHSKPAGNMANLNPEHSHFILIDDGRNDDEEAKFGQEMNLRSDLLAVMTDYNWIGKRGNGGPPSLPSLCAILTVLRGNARLLKCKTVERFSDCRLCVFARHVYLRRTAAEAPRREPDVARAMEPGYQARGQGQHHFNGTAGCNRRHPWRSKFW